MTGKKKYAIQWENDEAVAFEINGKTYRELAAIPSQQDRLKIMAMITAAGTVEAEASSGFPIEKVILAVFTGVAVLMLAIAGISTASALNRISREKSAPAAVIEMVKRYQYDDNDRQRVTGEFYYPVVRFTAEDGRRREVQLAEGSFPPSYEVGDEVTVRYNPEKPIEARIDSFGSRALMFILPGITGILGVAFLGAVWVVRHVTK